MQLGVWSKGGNSLESGRGKMFERWLKLGVLHPVSQYSYIRANILKKIHEKYEFLKDNATQLSELKGQYFCPYFLPSLNRLFF